MFKNVNRRSLLFPVELARLDFVPSNTGLQWLRPVRRLLLRRIPFTFRRDPVPDWPGTGPGKDV